MGSLHFHFDCQSPANFKEFYGNEEERTFKSY